MMTGHFASNTQYRKGTDQSYTCSSVQCGPLSWKVEADHDQGIAWQRRRSQGEFELCKLYLCDLCESPRAKVFVVCIEIVVFKAKGGFTSKTKARVG